MSVGVEGGIGVQGGIGILGISTVTVLLLLLTYPGYWIWRLSSLDTPPGDIKQARLWFVIALVLSLAVVPSSFADRGFLFPPIAVAVIAFVYATVHASLSNILAKEDRLPSVGVFLGFLLPLLLTLVPFVGIAFWQAIQVTEMGLEGVAHMNTVVVPSMITIGALPILVASVHIMWARNRSKRRVS